jgi:hypothetical protein
MFQIVLIRPPILPRKLRDSKLSIQVVLKFDYQLQRFISPATVSGLRHLRTMESLGSEVEKIPQLFQDGLRVLKVDSMDPQFTRSLEVFNKVVDEDRLFRFDTQPVEG